MNAHIFISQPKSPPTCCPDHKTHPQNYIRYPVAHLHTIYCVICAIKFMVPLFIIPYPTMFKQQHLVLPPRLSTTAACHGSHYISMHYTDIYANCPYTHPASFPLCIRALHGHLRSVISISAHWVKIKLKIAFHKLLRKIKIAFQIVLNFHQPVIILVL